MLKIPTLYTRVRGHAGPVTRDLNPDVVSDWLGYAAPETLIWSRKIDGTCTMFDGTDWWARREVKSGKYPPTGFVTVYTDPNTGNTMGWVPMVGSQFEKFHDEALANLIADTKGSFPKGTYELVGPRINGNPEKIERHLLVHHGALALPHDMQGINPGDYDAVKKFLDDWNSGPGYFEGLVLTHTPTGRRAKIKHKDFYAS